MMGTVCKTRPKTRVDVCRSGTATRGQAIARGDLRFMS